jgi:MFS family permease
VVLAAVPILAQTDRPALAVGLISLVGAHGRSSSMRRPTCSGVTLLTIRIGGLVGSLLASRLGSRFGVGHTVVACNALSPVAYLLLASAPSGTGGWSLVGLGQLVLGFSIGAANSSEMGYRRTVTPDRLQGRMNATMRSIDRAMIVIAAPLGGLLADAIGDRLTMWIVAAGLPAVAGGLAVPQFRNADITELPPD